MYLLATNATPEGSQLVVRSKLPAEVLTAEVIPTLRKLNPAQPATAFRPVQTLVDHAVSPPFLPAPRRPLCRTRTRARRSRYPRSYLVFRDPPNPGNWHPLGSRSHPSLFKFVFSPEPCALLLSELLSALPLPLLPLK